MSVTDIGITKPWNEGTISSRAEISVSGIVQNDDPNTDEFGSDTAQPDMKAGGDGAKLFGWNVFNSANADAIDVNTGVAGALYFDLNGNSTTWRNAVFTAPFVFKEISESEDFDIDVSLDLSDADENFEAGGLFVRSPDTGGGENWIGIFTTLNITQLVADTTVNDVTSDVIDNSNTDTFFRIRKVGDVYTLFSRASGGETAWTQRAQYTRSDFTGTLQVGISFRTVNVSDNFEGSAAYFRDITPYSTAAQSCETDPYTFSESFDSDDILVKLGRTPLAATEIKVYVQEDAGAFGAAHNVDVTPIAGETGWFKFAAGTTYSNHSTVTLRVELNSPDTGIRLEAVALKIKGITIVDCDYPVEADVRFDIIYDNGNLIGNYVPADPAKHALGDKYGSLGTEFTGTKALTSFQLPEEIVVEDSEIIIYEGAS